MGWLAVRRADIATLVAAVLLALAAGAVTALEPRLAVAAVAAGGLLILAAVLGAKAFPWFLVLFAVIPFYPFTEGPPRVPEEAVAVFAGAVLAIPWGWALIQDRERLRRWRPADVLLATAIGAAAVTSLVASSPVGGTDPLPLAGLVIAPAAFFGGQRFSEARDWGPPTTVGLGILLVLGGLAYAANPDERVGFFTGYPITYAALLVVVLPPALRWTWRRARLLTFVLAPVSAAMLVLSQTRSAWLAVTAMLAVWCVFLVTSRRWRALGAVLVLVVMVLGLVAATDTLSEVVRTRLSASEFESESVTHRQSMYSYAYRALVEDPILGVGYAGASRSALLGITGIEATDNGFLAAGADLGLVGLVVALTPALALLFALYRLLLRSRPDDFELALALGLVGLFVVTLFFDTFYRPQTSLLMFALAGLLSARGRGDPRGEPSAAAAA